MLVRSAILLSTVVFPQGTTLRWTPKEGQEYKLRSVGQFTVNGLEAKMTAVNTHKVLRIDPDGSYLVQVSPVEGEVEFGGNKQAMKGLTSLVNYGPKGEVKEIRGEKQPGTAGRRMANLTTFHPPAKSVSLNDTWTSEGKSDTATGAVAWKADFKVVGEETIGSFPAYKIEVTARETDGSDAGKAVGTFWIGKDGILVRSELTWTNMPVPGAPSTVNGKLTVMRLE